MSKMDARDRIAQAATEAGWSHVKSDYDHTYKKPNSKRSVRVAYDSFGRVIDAWWTTASRNGAFRGRGRAEAVIKFVEAL